MVTLEVLVVVYVPLLTQLPLTVIVTPLCEIVQPLLLVTAPVIVNALETVNTGFFTLVTRVRALQLAEELIVG
jgi:hypothetical protein